MSSLGITLQILPDMGQRLETKSEGAALSQAILCRLTTKRGALYGYPNYGLDLREWSSQSFSKRDIFVLESSIASECKKDERVFFATATVTVIGLREIKVQVTLGTDSGTFKLTILATPKIVELLQES